jgi:hypothetical protein
MVYLKKIWQWIRFPYTRYKEHVQYKKRIAELKKRDPFIYK